MKRVIISTLLLVAFLSAFTIVSHAADSQAVYATVEPKIDGEIDDIWSTAPEMQASYPEEGVWLEGENATGYSKILWTEQHLYLLAVVTDKTIPQSDEGARNSVDLWVSEMNTKAPDYASSPGDWLFCYASTGETSYYTGNEDIYTKASKAVKLTDTGYVIEVKAPYLSGLKPQVGHVIGFNASYNDDVDLDGVRDAWISWQDPLDRPYYQQTDVLNEVEFIAAPEPPAEEITETAEDNPQTSESVVFLFSVMALVSVCGILLAKKIRV